MAMQELVDRGKLKMGPEKGATGNLGRYCLLIKSHQQSRLIPVLLHFFASLSTSEKSLGEEPWEKGLEMRVLRDFSKQQSIRSLTGLSWLTRDDKGLINLTI